MANERILFMKKIKAKLFRSNLTGVRANIEYIRFANFLWKNIPKIKKIVVIGVGDPECFIDSIGPRCISEIQKICDTIPMYGNLVSPITRSKVENYKQRIKQEYPNAFVIAIDSSLGRLKPGSVQVDTHPLKPAIGLKKDCEEIGDLSILAVVGESEKHLLSKHMDRSVKTATDFIVKGLLLWICLCRKEPVVSIDFIKTFKISSIFPKKENCSNWH